MKFGQPLEFDHSENNLTHGIPMQLTRKVEFNANDVPRYRPRASLCYGANTDTQR